MTTEHKLAWALRAAADALDAGREPVFIRPGGRHEMSLNGNITGDIYDVVKNPDHDWQLVKEPVVTHEYYLINTDTKNYINIKTAENLKQWNMHITLIDGVPQKEVEFR